MKNPMKEVEKKARVPQHRYEEIKRRLTEIYGLPEHIVAEDTYYAMPPTSDGNKNRFRIRKNYGGDPLQLQSIVANAKRKQTVLGNLENNVEHEFELRDEADLRGFVAMMEDFGAKLWYTKHKDKWLFVHKGDVEYHLELCTVPIQGNDEHFLEIEGVYSADTLSAIEEAALQQLIDRFITGIFAQFGIENAVETRPYRELMGVEYPKD